MAGRRTVIIGAGVVGAALADELSALGWTDITVVDQGDLPLTGGSSYRSFGVDMTNEHDPYEAGIGFEVKLDKGDFIGRDALVRRKENQTKTLACLTIVNPVDVALGNEPVHADGEPVGYVTSAAYGYTIDKGIAYARLPTEAAAVGTEVEIGYFDRCIPAIVTAEPLFDPKMTRLRG